MPLYEFRCDVCFKTKLERRTVAACFGPGAKPFPECPNGHGRMARALSPPGAFKLIGAGFHANDYPKGRDR